MGYGIPLLRCKKFILLGNHEYFTGLVDNWFEFLSQHGVKPLHNEHVRIQASEDSEASFYLAGVDDIFASKIRYSIDLIQLN